MQTFINQKLYPGEFLLHKKYAQSQMLLDLIWTHCNIVADIALLILEKHDFDKTGIERAVVTQAALLSDIGVYSCAGYEWMPGQPPQSRPYIQHGIVGAWILEQEGYLAEVIQAAHSHSGVGVTAQDVKSFGLDLPEADYVPRSQTQKLVAYASKFHSKSPKFKNTDDIKKSLERYGKDKVQIFEAWEEEFGTPNLDEIMAKYQQWHQGFQFQINQLTDKATQSTPATPAAPNLNSAGIAQ